MSGEGRRVEGELDECGRGWERERSGREREGWSSVWERGEGSVAGLIVKYIMSLRTGNNFLPAI